MRSQREELETEREMEMEMERANERERGRVRLQVGDSVDFVMSPKISPGRIPNPKTNPNMFLRFCSLFFYFFFFLCFKRVCRSEVYWPSRAVTKFMPKVITSRPHNLLVCLFWARDCWLPWEADATRQRYRLSAQYLQQQQQQQYQQGNFAHSVCLSLLLPFPIGFYLLSFACAFL